MTEVCPVCGNQSFDPAINEDGSQMGELRGVGRGKTEALSPFEYAVPPSITRYSDAHYFIRSRWRDKAYYEANYPDVAHKLTFGKNPTDRSLQVFKGLALLNDIHRNEGREFRDTTNSTAEGIAEYEFWMKPSGEYPEGLVFRIVGDGEPQILHSPQEGLPGPLPYRDIQGAYLWPFAHATFEQQGGKFYGRGLLDTAIPKQDIINQLDSHMLMTIQRVSNPVWIMPRGAVDVEELTGTSGSVIRWNPHAVAGTNARPERIPGENIAQSVFSYRELMVREFEDLTGVFDILRGDRPPGVEAFSALQLLVERSQARFTSAFASRSDMYQSWYGVALELERAYGPNERTMNLVGHNSSYTFKKFEKAQLQGSIIVAIEDGTNIPKTPLGKRAAIEHANQLGLLGPQGQEWKQDERHKALTQLGVEDMSPSLDGHVKSSLEMQSSFEDWARHGAPGLQEALQADAQIQQQMQQIEADVNAKNAAIEAENAAMPAQMDATGKVLPPEAQPAPKPLVALPEPPPNPLATVSPLRILPWHDPFIHFGERDKWLNTDVMREMFKQQQGLERVATLHFEELKMMTAPPPEEGAPPPDGAAGNAQAMASSNSNAGSPAEAGL